MSSACAHRWAFQRSLFDREPDGRFYSFYSRYDFYTCERCGEHKRITARRVSSLNPPSWYHTIGK